MSELREWLAGRAPPPPDALPLPLEAVDHADPLAGLATLGLRALERAVAAGGDRAGAFELLAADALLTYACEAACEVDAPGGALEELVERVGRRGG